MLESIFPGSNIDSELAALTCGKRPRPSLHDHPCILHPSHLFSSHLSPIPNFHYQPHGFACSSTTTTLNQPAVTNLRTHPCNLHIPMIWAMILKTQKHRPSPQQGPRPGAGAARGWRVTHPPHKTRLIFLIVPNPLNVPPSRT